MYHKCRYSERLVTFVLHLIGGATKYVQLLLCMTVDYGCMWLKLFRLHWCYNFNCRFHTVARIVVWINIFLDFCVSHKLLSSHGSEGEILRSIRWWNQLFVPFYFFNWHVAIDQLNNQQLLRDISCLILVHTQTLTLLVCSSMSQINNSSVTRSQSFLNLFEPHNDDDIGEYPSSQ